MTVFKLFLSILYIYLVFVPLFPVNRYLLGRKQSNFYKSKKIKFYLAIGLPFARNEGTREQSGFEPGIYGVCVFPLPRECLRFLFPRLPRKTFS